MKLKKLRSEFEIYPLCITLIDKESNCSSNGEIIFESDTIKIDYIQKVKQIELAIRR